MGSWGQLLVVFAVACRWVVWGCYVEAVVSAIQVSLKLQKTFVRRSYFQPKRTIPGQFRSSVTLGWPLGWPAGRPLCAISNNERPGVSTPATAMNPWTFSKEKNMIGLG